MTLKWSGKWWERTSQQRTMTATNMHIQNMPRTQVTGSVCVHALNKLQVMRRQSVCDLAQLENNELYTQGIDPFSIKCPSLGSDVCTLALVFGVDWAGDPRPDAVQVHCIFMGTAGMLSQS